MMKEFWLIAMLCFGPAKKECVIKWTTWPIPFSTQEQCDRYRADHHFEDEPDRIVFRCIKEVESEAK